MNKRSIGNLYQDGIYYSYYLGYDEEDLFMWFGGYYHSICLMYVNVGGKKLKFVDDGLCL